MQAIVFGLGDIEFGIDITQVREIDRVSPVTHVPRVAPYIEGVINLRGQLVPIVDLRARLGLPQKRPTKLARVIVAEVGDRCIGMVVDRVIEVTQIPVENIDDGQDVLAGLAAEYVGGLANIDGRVIILLAVHAILPSPSPAEAPKVVMDKERV
jgi:purine-binding chemotaxis protein CheW